MVFESGSEIGISEERYMGSGIAIDCYKSYNYIKYEYIIIQLLGFVI